MPDVLYVGGTLLFFAGMLALVRGLARLGAPDAGEVRRGR